MKLKHIIINIVVTSFLVFFVMWILPTLLRESVVKDVLAYIIGILLIPSLLFFSLFRGLWEAMHNVAFKIHLIVSFIFYSLLIALIQVIIYKSREKRQEKLSKS